MTLVPAYVDQAIEIRRSELDEEMAKILERNDLDMINKIKLYNMVLTRFLGMKQNRPNSEASQNNTIDVNVAKEILKQSRVPSPSIALDDGFINESLSELKTEEQANEAGDLRDQFAQMTKDFKSPNRAVFQMPQTPAAITKRPGKKKKLQGPKDDEEEDESGKATVKKAPYSIRNLESIRSRSTHR